MPAAGLRRMQDCTSQRFVLRSPLNWNSTALSIHVMETILPESQCQVDSEHGVKQIPVVMRMKNYISSPAL